MILLRWCPAFSFCSLTFSISVFCDVHSYGPDCSTYCVPVDQAEIGHFGCDSNTGEKYCLDGMFFTSLFRVQNDKRENIAHNIKST